MLATSTNNLRRVVNNRDPSGIICQLSIIAREANLVLAASGANRIQLQRGARTPESSSRWLPCCCGGPIEDREDRPHGQLIPLFVAKRCLLEDGGGLVAFLPEMLRTAVVVEARDRNPQRLPPTCPNDDAHRSKRIPSLPFPAQYVMVAMFYHGSFQEGIALAVSQSKAVICFVRGTFYPRNLTSYWTYSSSYVEVQELLISHGLLQTYRLTDCDLE